MALPGWFSLDSVRFSDAFLCSSLSCFVGFFFKGFMIRRREIQRHSSQDVPNALNSAYRRVQQTVMTTVLWRYALLAVCFLCAMIQPLCESQMFLKFTEESFSTVVLLDSEYALSLSVVERLTDRCRLPCQLAACRGTAGGNTLNRYGASWLVQSRLRGDASLGQLLSFSSAAQESLHSSQDVPNALNSAYRRVQQTVMTTVLWRYALLAVCFLCAMIQPLCESQMFLKFTEESFSTLPAFGKVWRPEECDLPMDTNQKDRIERRILTVGSRRSQELEELEKQARPPTATLSAPRRKATARAELLSLSYYTLQK
eukprot:gene3366-2331_t